MNYKQRVIAITSFVCFFYFQSISQKNMVDSMKNLLTKNIHDTTRAKTNIAIAWETRYENINEAKKYVDAGLALAQKTKRDGDIALGYKILGILADETDDYDKSLNHYLQAIVYYQKVKDTISIAKVEYNIGIIYNKLRQSAEAEKYFRNCLRVFERKNFTMGIPLSTQNIGISFFNSGQYDSALVYFLKANEIFKSNKLFDENILGNIGNCYYQKKDYPKAMKYLTACCDDFIAKQNFSSLYFNYRINLALVYAGVKQFDEAIKMLEESKAGFKKLGLDSTANYSRALENAARQYAKTKNFEQAWINISQALEINTQIFREDFSKKTSEMKEKYESEKKELSIGNLNKEAKLKDAEIKSQSMQKLGMAGGLTLMLAFSFVLIKSNLDKKKANAIIQKQKSLVDEKNKEILDSITYAKRLQNAILPSENLIRKHLPQSFILYKPKDIVAGDFYWFEEYGDQIFLAAADSTGHGVPGAMVSVVCSNALYRALNEFKISDTGKILDKARELVLETFSKSEENVMDGMDISLVSIRKNANSDNKNITWSGANNSLIYIKNGELNTIKAHKQTIGKTESPSPFPSHELELKKGDSFYLITDGFADQFGGPNRKKFKTSQLAELLAANHELNAKEMHELLNSTFISWKADLEQVDDLTIIGVKI